MRRHLEVARIDALDAVLGRAPAPPIPPGPRLARRPEEVARADEVLRDYVLAPYPPRRDPAGGLRAVNLLVESFAFAGLEDEGVAVIDRLRALLGAGRTVWGIKHAAGQLAWELYVYDPGGERPEAGADAVCRALDGVIAPPPALPAAIAPHMISVELTAASLRGGPAVISYYVHGTDEPGASRSYVLGPAGLALANLYTFHDPRRDVRALIARVRSSVHLGGSTIGVARAVWPQLLRCRRVCVANKRAADGMYFAGVDTDQLAWFLARAAWPAALRDHVDGRRGRYAYLSWDVGFDFVGDADVTRSAVYGTF